MPQLLEFADMSGFPLSLSRQTRAGEIFPDVYLPMSDLPSSGKLYAYFTLVESGPEQDSSSSYVNAGGLKVLRNPDSDNDKIVSLTNCTTKLKKLESKEVEKVVPPPKIKMGYSHFWTSSRNGEKILLLKFAWCSYPAEFCMDCALKNLTRGCHTHQFIKINI
ncbi:unnamed protein product [Allacma fusca]|uniref:Uncharacterized protein n=1 Tax=Allacma fusca TaxID=39272 RepID=A0A8J2LHQ9_9HEXA|nr:unnamed protein product [Allacma fusca]